MIIYSEAFTASLDGGGEGGETARMGEMEDWKLRGGYDTLYKKMKMGGEGIK